MQDSAPRDAREGGHRASVGPQHAHRVAPRAPHAVVDHHPAAEHGHVTAAGQPPQPIDIAADGIGSSDFAFEDETALKLGDRIGVYSGDESAPTEVFSGFVTGLEAEFSEAAVVAQWMALFADHGAG